MYSESDFAIEFFGLVLTIAWFYTVGGWVWRLLPNKWERNDGKFLVMFFVFLPTSTFFSLLVIYGLSAILATLGVHNQFVLGVLFTLVCCSIIWWAHEQNQASKNSPDDSGAITSNSGKSLEKPQTEEPPHQHVLKGKPFSNLSVTNFPSTISSIAMHLEQLFLSELLENNNVLPLCLLDDDYILGFCWAVSIKQAKQENLETFNLETDVKWEILILSLSRAIAVNPKVLEPKLRTAVRNKTDMFSSGYSDGSEYDWSSPSKAGDNFEDRKRALLES